MAWDKDKPAANDRITDSAANLRANWAAIEQGGVPYDYIKMKSLKIGETPINAPAEAGFVRFFCKDVTVDSEDKPELHSIDEDGNVTQLTQRGSIGDGSWLVDSNGNLQANSITFDGGTNAYDENSIVWAWAYWTESFSGINLRASYNIAGVERNVGSTGSGRYRVTFQPDNEPNSANYAVVVMGSQTAFNHTAIACLDETESKTTSSFVIRTFNRGTSLTNNVKAVTLLVVGSD